MSWYEVKKTMRACHPLFKIRSPQQFFFSPLDHCEIPFQLTTMSTVIDHPTHIIRMIFPHITRNCTPPEISTSIMLPPQNCLSHGLQELLSHGKRVPHQIIMRHNDRHPRMRLQIITLRLHRQLIDLP
mmetsp:Transcript_9769/g.20215  ORF Transcript_9769/g.20215 Transcript_9769/m.20215 type:complete len:128 (-) Transcript_9769:1493-1876(-)